MRTFTGGCQCGAVGYSVTGTAATLFACHCADCQRQSASAFGMAMWIKDFDVHLHHGMDQLKEWVRTMPSGRQMSCQFCGTCGTRLFHKVMGQEEIISIKPGTLNETTHLKPVGHIWTASKQAWLRIGDDELQYPGNPPSFGELVAAWNTETH